MPGAGPELAYNEPEAPGGTQTTYQGEKTRYKPILARERGFLGRTAEWVAGILDLSASLLTRTARWMRDIEYPGDRNPDSG